MNLTEAMEAAGLSIRGLADEAGMPASQIAGYRSGARKMSTKSAGRLAKHLDADSADLVLGNMGVSLKRAMDAGDNKGVFKTTRDILTFAEKAGASDEDLDAVVDLAERFFEDQDEEEDLVVEKSASSPFGGVVPFGDDHLDSERASAYALEGRDSMGRRIVRESAADDFEDDLEDEDDEDGYDLDDEGRDSRGIRVRPMRTTTGGF